MKHSQRTGRFDAMLAALGAALLALTAAALAAFAGLPTPSQLGAAGNPGPPQIRVVTHTVVAGGMPFWQVALLAVGAALLAATAAVLADRARPSHRHLTAAAT